MPNPPHQSKNPEVATLPVTASIDDIVDVIRRDGGVIIKNFITREDVAQIDKELEPEWDKKGVYKASDGALFNANDPPLRLVVIIQRALFTNNEVSGLCGKSPTVARKALNHPVFREVSKKLLRDIMYVLYFKLTSTTALTN